MQKLFSSLRRAVFMMLAAVFSTVTVAGQTLTISSATSSGSGWSLSGGTLTVTANAIVNISEINSALSSGSLTIVGNTSNFSVTLSSAISSTTSGSNLTIGSVNNTGSITLNAAISLAGAATFHADAFTLESGIGISTSSASDITINANGNFNTWGTTRRTISSVNGSIIIHADKDANGAGQLDLDYLTLNAGSGATIIRGETVSFTPGSFAGPYINGTGSFTFESSDASFGQQMETSWFEIDQDGNGISALTFGKSGSTQNINNSSNLTIAGPVNYTGSNIYINATLTATSSDITLRASASISQSQAMTANGLALTGTGTVTLTHTSNNFITLAGGAVGTLIGATQIIDASGGLTIGTVGSNVGLRGSGTIKVETLAGNLTLAGSINTTSTSTDAVILTAAKNTAIGIGTGGDILVSGSPTITMGTGGIAKLFSGLETTSTGLTTLAGGSSNVRYNYDETTSSFSPVLAANNSYAIYRTNSGVGALTIVSSGGDAVNSTWTYDNGVITTIATPVNILSSVIENYLTLGSLSINAGNTTISSAITSTSSNALVFNANSTLSIPTPTTTVNAAITNAGSITFNTGTFNITQDLSTTSTAAITISATNQIATSTDTRRTIISTQGGNITLNADADANGSGYLDIDDLTLDPHTGNSIVRGETFNFNPTQSRRTYINGTGSFTFESNDASFGSNIASSWFVIDQDADGISGLTIGKSGSTANIYLNTAFTVAGPITVYGGYVEITGNITSSADGDIFIKSTGYGGAASTYIGSITINKSAGTGTLTFQSNGWIQNYGTLSATGTGRLNVVMWSDFDNSNNDGGISQFGTISTNGGHVWVGGSSAASGTYTWNGLTVGDGPSIGTWGYNCNAIDFFGPITTSGGDVLIWASNNGGCGIAGIASDATRLINAGSGDITLIAYQTSGTIELTSTGVISLLPHGGSYTSALTLGGTLTSGNFTFNTSHYNGLKINSLATTGLVIGNYSEHLNVSTPVTQGNTSTVTASTALSTKSLGIYGGAVVVSAALTAAGDIILDGDNGSFLSQNTKGVDINAAVTTSNNGNITLIGRGGSGSAQSENYGVYVRQTVEADGTGTITVTGTGGLSSNGAASSSHGVSIEGASAWLKSNGGNVTVTGNGGGANSGSYSQGVALNTNGRISAGSTGTVTITGTGGVNTAVGLRGVVVVAGSSIYTAGGAISITGNAGTNGSDNSDGFSIDNATVGSNTSGAITITGTAGGGTGSEAISLSTSNTIGGASHAGNITLRGNSFSITGTNTVQTTAQVAIEPTSTSFSSALNYPISNLTVTSTGLRLGKSGNTANLNFTSNVSVPGPITVYAGPVSLAANLTTTGSGDISIYSDASLTASGGVRTATAAGLFKYMPDGTSFSSGVSYPIGNLTVSSNGLQLGKPGNTAAMTITGAASSNGPVTVYTGAFTTDATATLTATGSALEVNASGIVTLNADLYGSTTTINGQGNVQTIGTLTNLNLEGGNAQSITGTATLTNMTLNKSAGTASLTAGRQNLTGTLTLTAGTLAAGGYLTLKSSATGTARVAQHAASTGNVTGNVVVERFVPGARKMQWRMLAFPYNAPLLLSNITGIKINYTSPQTMMYFREHFDDGNNYGNTGTRNGGYQTFTSNTQTIAAGQGVAAWVYGDESTSATPGAGTLGAGGITVSSLGELNETGADVSIPITNLTAGWNLVGNPFASTIDWELVRTASSNLSAVLYRWDPQAENWTLFNNSGGTTGNGSRFIESGSAFFVKSAAAGAMTLTIPQSAKVTSSPDLHFTKNPFKLDIPGQRVGAASSLAGLRLKASGMGNPIPGEAYLDVSKTDATKGWDPQYDGLMMARTSGANVYFDGANDNDYSMHFDQPLMNGEQRYYPITVTTPKAGETLIEVSSEGNWSSMHSVALIDQKLGRTILMRDGQLSYKITLEDLKSEGRFILAINHVKLSADGQSPVFEVKALGNPVTTSMIDLLISHPTAAAKSWRVVDAAGRETGSGVFASQGGIQHRLTVPGMRNPGAYIVQVEMDNGETKQVRILKN